ncbi:MAG: hypothetical protein QXD16_04185, partial [Sulfolobales archaeon]
NRVFLDAFRRGGDLAEVGKKLSNFVVKVLELRKTRLSTAKSFEIMTVIMQPLIVTMLILMTSLLKFFSATLVNLPFFTFGEVPISFIELGNVVNVIILTVLNALAVGSARGGFWGTILMYSGVLMILSAGSWFLTERLITPYISEMFGTVQWIPT